ncbi:hypothetical protein [Acinetobacter sp. Marseille-Q1618]|uniref:hypothetical protein n=1 Tax=Acinetobacter sp. Marseille-Q1618 TaxID=2697502 RepID=UPI00156FB8E0|nr:hypothetical protein [Acinetobacter sp. Marseille-Q1618]
MVSPKHRGTVDQFETKDMRVDTRDIFQKMHDALRKSSGSQNFALTVTIITIFCVIYPFFFFILIPIVLLITRFYLIPQKRFHNMPYRVPKHANLPDGSFDALGRNVSLAKNPEKTYGEGTYYYGIDRNSYQQVWKTDSDERVHDLLIGTTGAGKTEAIKMVLTNPLLQNSGFIMSDAKGTTELVAELMYLTTRFMRQDDILVTNFITAGRDLLEKQEDKLTNTFNLMAYTSASMLGEQLVYLLDDSGSGGGDMWKGRTINYLSALTTILCFLRDRGLILLEPKTYVEYQELSPLIRIAYGEDYHENYKRFGEKYNTAVSPLRAYLGSLAAFDANKLYKQHEKTNEQHGYVIMSFSRAIGELSFNFGHIYGDRASEIDMFDVVLNRRCLLIVLPSLQNSPDKIKMLGKLCVGSLKQMMAGALGNRIDGVVRSVIESKVTASKTCYKVVLDEVGYQIVAGLSVIPAQARGLSFSMTFSAQDISDILRADEKEGEAIIANTGSKTIGRINSGEQGQTFTKIKGIVSTANQATAQGFNTKQGDLMGASYQRAINVSVEKRDKITYEDLATQQDGQFTHIVAKKLDGGRSGIISTIQLQTMFVQPPKLKKIRLNDFISIERDVNFFDSVEYDSNIEKLANDIAENQVRHSNPDYEKTSIIGSGSSVHTEMEDICLMIKQNEGDVKSSFYAVMRTIQNIINDQKVNQFGEAGYEVIDLDDISEEVINHLDDLYEDVKIKQQQLDLVLEEHDKKEKEKLIKQNPTAILDSIAQSSASLDPDQIQTVSEIKEYISNQNFINHEQVYSNEFVIKVQKHLSNRHINISPVTIPTLSKLKELDDLAFEVQKQQMQYVENSNAEELDADIRNRHQFIENFIYCRDIVINNQNQFIDQEDKEIMKSIETIIPMVYDQITKKFKDE